MDSERTNQLCEQYRRELLEGTVPWWQARFIDEECGGFLTYRDADGTLLSTDKSVWTLARAIWLWSRLFNTVERREEWLDVARHGMDFMCRHAFDDDGRMFYSLTREGRPLRQRRYLFSETFGTIAFAEFARASGSQEMLDRARATYRLILRHHTTPGLLKPKVNPATRALRGHAMPMILVATSQVMREVDPDPLYDDVIGDQTATILGDFVRPDKRCLLECILANGGLLDTPEGRTVNPGHAIETSWFLMAEARHRGDADLLADACRVLEWSLEIGWDPEHGGILYFVDCDGKPAEPYEHEMKLWWPHTEALYACLLAHHLTGDSKWASWYERVHDWAWTHFPDVEFGEWFGYLRRDGSLSSRVKGNMWKGPFHLPRAQLNCWQLLQKMMAGTTLEGGRTCVTP